MVSRLSQRRDARPWWYEQPGLENGGDRGAARRPSRADGWRPLLRAAGLTGAAALGGAALSVVATKIFAAMLGPAEVAVLATLQQIRQAGVIGATLNGQTALVQGASARSGDDRRQYLAHGTAADGDGDGLLSVGLLAAPGWVASSTGLGMRKSADGPLDGRAGGVLRARWYF